MKVLGNGLDNLISCNPDDVVVTSVTSASISLGDQLHNKEAYGYLKSEMIRGRNQGSPFWRLVAGPTYRIAHQDTQVSLEGWCQEGVLRHTPPCRKILDQIEKLENPPTARLYVNSVDTGWQDIGEVKNVDYSTIRPSSIRLQKWGHRLAPKNTGFLRRALTGSY